MNTILSEYFTLATSVKNKKNLKYCLFRSLTFLKPATLSLWTISLDSLVVVKKDIYSNFGSKFKSPV